MMDNYREDYCYVDIHGNDVQAQLCEKTNEICFPLDELKHCGFTIYSKSQYKRTLSADIDFSSKFDLYMLESAEAYMLRNQIVFNEHDILESIQKCKLTLLQHSKEIKTFSSSTASESEPEPDRTQKLGSFTTESFNRAYSFESNNVERVPCIELDQPEHEVLITHVEADCFWVQDTRNAQQFINIQKSIQQLKPEIKVISAYDYSQIYIAQLGDEWFRCKIIKFKPTLRVFFMDLGMTAQTSELKEAPENIRGIPGQAVKILLPRNRRVEVYDMITIKILKKYGVGTYMVDVKDDALTPKEDLSFTEVKNFLTEPQLAHKFQHGQRIIILNHSNGSLVIRTEECFNKLQQIGRILARIELEEVPKVEKGQLVLYKKDTLLLRAIVLSPSGDSTVEIEFLDHFESKRVNKEHLYNINAVLAKEPRTYVLTPKIEGYTKSVDGLFRELSHRMVMGSVVLSNGKFDVEIDNEGLLSQTIKYLNRPRIEDFKPAEFPLGLDEYVLIKYSDLEHIYLASRTVLNNTLYEAKLDSTDSYEPIIDEVCFGSYQDSWCRCVVRRILENLLFEVDFMDIPNSAILTSAELRELTEDAKDINILTAHCQLTELSRGGNAEELIQKYLIEGHSYKVNIKKFNGSVYEIEIPGLI